MVQIRTEQQAPQQVAYDSLAASTQALHCPPQLNLPKLPILPVIAAAMERMREQEAALKRRMASQKGKLIDQNS